MPRIKFILNILFIAFVLILPFQAAALPTPVPPVYGEPVTLYTIETILRIIARFLIITSVIVAVIAIIWSGILWTTAGASEARKTSAKDWFRNGVIGALIILAVGVILWTLVGLVTRFFFF